MWFRNNGKRITILIDRPCPGNGLARRIRLRCWQPRHSRGLLFGGIAAIECSLGEWQIRLCPLPRPRSD